MTCDRCGQPHNRCAAHNRKGNPCGEQPTPGTDKCHLHAGVKLEVHRAIGQARLAFSLPRYVSPHDALLEAVHRAAGQVSYAAAVIDALSHEELTHGVTKAIQRVDGKSERTFEAVPHVWVKMYQDALRDLARFSKLAIDAGIEERRVRVAEETASVVVDVLRASLVDLGVDPSQPEVAAAVARHLRAVS